MQLLATGFGEAGVEGIIIFLVAWFVVAQFVLPRLGIRPG